MKSQKKVSPIKKPEDKKDENKGGDDDWSSIPAFLRRKK